jgi:hypothetical protein
MLRTRSYIACLPAALAFVWTASGQNEDEIDVLICRSAADPSLLVTGEEDERSGELTVPRRVFTESVEPLAGLDDLRGDEGFFAVTDPNALPPGYTPLPGLTDVRFDFKAFTIAGVTANLWRWDPGRDPDVVFHPAADGVVLKFQKAPSAFFTATVDGSPHDVPGFVIDTTSPAGLLHQHLTIVLDDADSDLATPVPTGVYLVSLTLGLSPGPATSEPMFEVIDGNLGVGGAALVQQAVDFVEALIRPACPADLFPDGVINQSDLGVLLSDYGCTPSGRPCAGDIDGDGDTDQQDLGLLLSAYGKPCD